MAEPDPTPGGSHRLSTTIVLSLGAVGAAMIAMLGQESAFGPVTIAGALLGLVPWALVAGGVRVPPGVFAACSLVCAALIVVVDENPGGMFPVMFTVVWVARQTDNRWILASTVAGGAALITGLALIDGSAHESGLVYFLGGLGISFLTGRMLRRQEVLTDELQAMQTLRVEHAAAAERTHIAREVHDVVAHSLTVVMLHLTGARRALATDPARADAALERAEVVGRQSLDSIRRMVGLLRAEADAAGGTAMAPLPGLGDLRPLVDGYRVGGLDIVDTLDVDTLDVDPARQLVVYRVVQESLSNVLQHGRGAACTVLVSASGSPPHDDLHVAIENEPPPGGSSRRPSSGSDLDHPEPLRTGLGLQGMSERVRAAGGSFAAGPTPAGGWRVEVELPLAAAAVRSAPAPRQPANR